MSTYHPRRPISQNFLSDVKDNDIAAFGDVGNIEVGGTIPIQGKEFNVALVGIGSA